MNTLPHSLDDPICNRRQFLARSAIVGASLSQAGSLFATSANEQINVGIIGCGWRGGQLLEGFLKLDGVSVTGLCDPDQEVLSKAATTVPEAQTWTDMRHMLDSPDIDAVAIANPNHWHCLSAIWALQAGKDIYVEKPLGQTEWEGQQLVKAVNTHGRICQVGTQQRSDPMQAEIRDFLHVEKALGSIKRVEIHRLGVRQSIGKREYPMQPPKTVDYNLWLGPAEDQSILRSAFHYDWHWKWNTGSGEMGNWGVHILDDVRGNVFLDQVNAPSIIAATGGRYVWNDAGDTPNLQFSAFVANEIPVMMAVCNLPRKQNTPRIRGPESGYVVYCEGGRYEGERGKGIAFDNESNEIRRFRGDEGNGHQANFIDAVRANDSSRLNTPVHMGYASTSWSNLANIATRLQSTATSRVNPLSQSYLAMEIGERNANESMQFFQKVIDTYRVGEAPIEPCFAQVFSFDTVSGRFIGPSAEAANGLLRREDRKPFVVPELVSTIDHVGRR